MNSGLKRLTANILKSHAARIVRDRGQVTNLGDYVDAATARALVETLGHDTPSGNVPPEVLQLEAQLGLTVQTRTAALALAKVLELEAERVVKYDDPNVPSCPEPLRRLILEAVGEASTLMVGDMPADPVAALGIANRIIDGVSALTIPREG